MTSVSDTTMTNSEEDPVSNYGYNLAHPPSGEEVVISGMGGLFPESDSLLEFGTNLCNKKDLISRDDRRWKHCHPEIPHASGKVNHVSKFDAAFFGVHYKQATYMDPLNRMLLERVYEAIIDAGVNPKELQGTTTGVFVGTCFSEMELMLTSSNVTHSPFSLVGAARTMLPNRVSYWLGCIGPSYTLDTACSSSSYAIEHAYRAIRDGRCDAAIVAGTNLCIHPYVTLNFAKLGILATDGKCKCFDQNADGYVRAEAIVVAFLQKAKDARRIYAQIAHVKTNCDGYKPEGITFPGKELQKKLIKDVYSEAQINPQDIEYLEAHCTGTRVGDPQELGASVDVFCKGRNRPLRIGSVKSNMGHSEPSSGLCSIAKIVYAYSTGIIPPNINFKNPREEVKSLTDGTLIVNTEPTPWNRGIVGINNFGFGGANAHIVLKNMAKRKIDNAAPIDDLPRLVLISGRTEPAVNKYLDHLDSRRIDVEFIKLLHCIHQEEIPGHIYRGFILLDAKAFENVGIIRSVEYYAGARRPVWFVFSGMGSQWNGMGTDLMKIPIFAAAIERCHQILKPKGLNIADIITNPDPKVFANILNSFVGIASIQIGLCDILKAVNIQPDFLIGHSVGELGCAYADGCFDTEQMILSAYSRGLASIESKFIYGSMAAIGLGYQQIKSMVPSDIEIACHNSSDSCTISGPADSVKKYVATLTAKGIFAKEVQSSNIPYHSKYINSAAPKFLKYLKRVIPNPKKRSSRWISTSLPQLEWNLPKALWSSAEYHTNNLLNPVLFEEASRAIPSNAITIEIAPHGLLQAILRRSLAKTCTNVPLTKRDHPDSVEFLMTSFGKLFEVGINPNIAELYPNVKLPVSIETPMISHLVEWEHSDDFPVPYYKPVTKLVSSERHILVDMADDSLEYLYGHVVDGRNLYPATGYLTLVWETFAQMQGVIYQEQSVLFEDIKFLRGTSLPKDGSVEFVVMIHKGSGNFEIADGNVSVVTGRISALLDTKSSSPVELIEPPKDDTEYLAFSNKDFYKELRLRGYNYSGQFRGVENCNVTGTRGSVTFAHNWVTFLDSMLQMKILTLDTRGLFVPTSIVRLTIDVKNHYGLMESNNNTASLPITVHQEHDIIRCGGVEINGLFATSIAKRQPAGVPVLEKYEFVPHFGNVPMLIEDAVRFMVQLMLENIHSLKVKTLEIIDVDSVANKINPLSPLIRDTLADLPLLQPEITVLTGEELDLGDGIKIEDKNLPKDNSAFLVVGANLLQDSQLLNDAHNAIKEGGFIVTRELIKTIVPITEKFYTVSVITVGDEKFVLLKMKLDPKPTKYIKIDTSNCNFEWISEVKSEIMQVSKLVLISEKETFNGILGLVNCLRREPGGEIVKCLLIDDKAAPNFNPDLPFYEIQLEKDLSFNVLRDGEWGSYHHLALKNLDSVEVDHCVANVLVRGDLSSVKWLEGPLKLNRPLNIPGKETIQVYYSSLNFRDIMVATGRVQVDCKRQDIDGSYGMEFSGRTSSGERLMGFTKGSGLASIVNSNRLSMWKIPDHWSLEDAATIPIAYATVYYSLILKGQMKGGETVLVHVGSGGVGQAAIHICHYYGCTVFTTVGTQEKREFIKNRYPQIKDSHIGNSRNTSFREMILRETNGRGVDIVLNSLAEDKLKASIECLAPQGQFFEIGKYDILNNSKIGMSFLMRETSIKGIMMDSESFLSTETGIKICKILEDGIKSGAIQPLSRKIFSHSELENSFRYMAAGKHIGKVLIKMRDEEKQIITIPQPVRLPAKPRYMCEPGMTYIIVGGLGGFGLELADWLVLRGCRKLSLVSRKGVCNGYQSSRIKVWRSYGAEVEVYTDDVTTKEGTVSMFSKAMKQGPIHAVFNLAVVLNDAVFENQTAETFSIAFNPKVTITNNLDVVSRELCPLLSEFVVFSSVSCGRGNAGQTNYGMANSIMERTCEERKKIGLPALAIQWGAVGDVGLVADMQEEHTELEIGGTLQQRITSCLEVLDQFLYQDAPVVSSMVVAEKRIGARGGLPVDVVANIMGLKDLKKVSPQVSLAELGMDSMMALEINQVLEREFEIFLTAQEMRTLTFARLHELTAERELKNSPMNTNKNDGEANFVKMFVGMISDEESISEPIVHMKTLIGVHTEEDIVLKKSHVLYMIPGVEGTWFPLTPLCKKIKFHASVLQLPYNNEELTIQDIAQRVLKVLRPRLFPAVPFSLLGYSLGSLVALEVMSMLEKEGFTGTLFCVEGSPDYLKTMMQRTGNVSNEEIEDNILKHLFDLVVPNGTSDALAEFFKTSLSWEEKVDKMLSIVPEETNSKIKLSTEHKKAFANSLYDRFKAAREFNMKNFKKLNSEIILLRIKDSISDIEDNYGLEKYSERPIKTYRLEGDHSTIRENKECANIINKILTAKENDTAKKNSSHDVASLIRPTANLKIQ